MTKKIQVENIQSALLHESNRLYVTTEFARDEIWKRFYNEDLQKEVALFLGNDIPKVFQGRPRVVLARSVASPNKEAVHFLNIAEELNLQPLFLEYLSDKFVSKNFDKHHLSRLFFYNETGKQGGARVTAHQIVDMNCFDGKPINTVQTKWNESFVGFHHRLFEDVLSCDYLDSSADVSAWLKRQGGNAKSYYPKYLSLFMCYAVYAELFLLDTDDDRLFFENIVLPAMKVVEKNFGMLPLITQVSPVHLGADISWKYYPEFVKTFIPCNALELDFQNI